MRVDSLQVNILKLLWAHPQATVKFEVLVRMLKESYNTVRLACERLQARGFVAGNFYDSNTLVQLTNEGREYMDKRGLNERAEHFLLTQFRRAEIEESRGH
jgi:predicted transcriptional regulator